jgi:phosphoenolpyruvate-protein kinase (PTS system EI component)
VPRVKARVRELDLQQCEVTAKAALVLDGAAEVRELVASKIEAAPAG